MGYLHDDSSERLDQIQDVRVHYSHRLPVGDGYELVRFPFSDSFILVSSTESAFLHACESFHSIEEHARTAANFPGLGMRDAVQLLTRTRQIGGLIARSEFLGLTHLKESGRPCGSPEQIKWLAVPTGGRPQELERCLRSYARNTREFCHPCRFLVSDDFPSTRSEESDERARVSRLAEQERISCVYISRGDQDDICARLSAAVGVPLEVVRFGLMGECLRDHNFRAYGGNRNCIQLLTQGALILSVDDDTICKPGIASENGPTSRTKFTPLEDPIEQWFYETQESALHAATWSTIDVVGAHEGLLGHSLRDLLSSPSRHSSNDLTSISQIALRAVCRNEGQVLLSYNGIIGDSGFCSGSAALHPVNIQTRSRLLASQDVFRRALTSRAIIRHSSNSVVSNVSPCVSTCLGIDNRVVLPPFIPIGRGEDGLFGSAIECCTVASFGGHLPFGLVHSPGGGRTYMNRPAAVARACEIFNMLIWRNGVPPPAATTADYLSYYGKRVSWMAALKETDFCELIRTTVAYLLGRHVSLLERELTDNPDAPQWWKDVLISEVKDTLAALNSNCDCSDMDLRSLQVTAQLTGELLQSWSVLCEASHILHPYIEEPITRHS